jgi:putative effector of murein hydrolase LrgA (UPF0299 family)
MRFINPIFLCSSLTLSSSLRLFAFPPQAKNLLDSLHILHFKQILITVSFIATLNTAAVTGWSSGCGISVQRSCRDTLKEPPCIKKT